MENCMETDDQGLRKLVPITVLVEVPVVMEDAQIVHALVDMLSNGQDSMKEPNPRFTHLEGRRPENEDWVVEIDGKVLEVWDALAIRFMGVEVDKSRPVMRCLKGMHFEQTFPSIPVPGLPHTPKKIAEPCPR